MKKEENHTMDAKQLWDVFSEHYPEHQSADYQAWSYGAAADELADLTVKGIKTATASAYELYALENEPLPKAGEWNVILDDKGQAVCITQTTNVSVVPYNEVTPEHAFKEGEGDRSLTYWKEVHQDFFSKEYQAKGLEFNETIPVVCEEFEMVFKAN